MALGYPGEECRNRSFAGWSPNLKVETVDRVSSQVRLTSHPPERKGGQEEYEAATEREPTFFGGLAQGEEGHGHCEERGRTDPEPD